MKLTMREADYLETIYRLSRTGAPIGISDIARERGVTLPTVISAVSRLRNSGLVSQSHYGKITLNQSGLEAAESVYEVHRLLVKFFEEILLLSPEQAEQNACRLEHDLSPEAVSRLAAYVGVVKGCVDRGGDCLKIYRDEIRQFAMPDSRANEQHDLE